jgi:hypothetical protein
MKKHLLVALCVTIFERLFGFLFYGLLFNAEMQEYITLFRPSDSKMWFCVIGLDFIAGFILSYIYFWLQRNLKPQVKLCPYHFTIVYTIITRVFGELFNFSIFPYSAKLTTGGILTGISSAICIGFILHLINKINNKKV